MRRGIPLMLADKVLKHPQQVVPERGSRKAYQSRLEFDDGRVYLLRMIVDELKNDAVVVTGYRTSKIEKYWSRQ